MEQLIVASSILFLLGAGSACKNDEEKKTDPTTPAVETPTTDTPVASIDAAPEAAAPAEGTTSAEVTIAAASGSKVAGTVKFKQKLEVLEVVATFTGLTPGNHGFHIHETGDCSSADAKSAGGHFNPYETDHGSPNEEIQHAGDLGNVIATDDGTGRVILNLHTSRLSLNKDSANNIAGRAVVVHGGPDDMKSQPSGKAGPRVGCGVIKLAE